MEENSENKKSYVIRFNRPLLLNSGFEENDYRLVWGFLEPDNSTNPDFISEYVGYLATTHMQINGYDCPLTTVFSNKEKLFFMDREGAVHKVGSPSLKEAFDAITRQIGISYHLYCVDDYILDCIDMEEYLDHSWILSKNFFYDLEEAIDDQPF